MSAPSLAPSITSFTGAAAAPVMRRPVEARPANDDADAGPDFAAALNKADTSANKPVRTTAPTRPSGSPPEKAAPGENDEAEVTEVTVLAAASPVTVSAPVVPPALVAAATSEPEATSAGATAMEPLQTPIPGDALPDSLPLAPTPPVAGTDDTPTPKPETLVGNPGTQTGEPEAQVGKPATQTDEPETLVAKPAIPASLTPVDPTLAGGFQPPSAPADAQAATVAGATAAAVATVLVPVPRPLPTATLEKPASDSEASASSPPAAKAGEATPASDTALESASPPTPRVRDIVERVSGRGTDTPAQAQPPSDDGTSAANASSVPEAQPVAKPPSPSGLTGTPLPLLPAEPSAPGTQTVLASAPEVRVPDAAEVAARSPALSTTSRASVEATSQIAAQIIAKLDAKATRFEIALSPEDLGRVDVSLDIDADGQLAARLSFDNPVAAADLRSRVDELRRQLEDAGFKLSRDALSFTERDPAAGQGRGQGDPSDRRQAPSSTRAFGAASRLGLDADLAASPRWIQLSLTPDRVDLKV